METEQLSTQSAPGVFKSHSPPNNGTGHIATLKKPLACQDRRLSTNPGYLHSVMERGTPVGHRDKTPDRSGLLWPRSQHDSEVQAPVLPLGPSPQLLSTKAEAEQGNVALSHFLLKIWAKGASSTEKGQPGRCFRSFPYQ